MKTKIKNPFYVLLVLVGIAFVITASAYSVMAVRGTDRSESALPQAGLLGFMDRHGDWLLIVEVLLLGLLTVAAMGMDEIGTRQSQTAAQANADQKLGTPIANQSERGEKA